MGWGGGRVLTPRSVHHVLGTDRVVQELLSLQPCFIGDETEKN